MPDLRRTGNCSTLHRDCTREQASPPGPKPCAAARGLRADTSSLNLASCPVSARGTASHSLAPHLAEVPPNCRYSEAGIQCNRLAQRPHRGASRTAQFAVHASDRPTTRGRPAMSGMVPNAHARAGGVTARSPDGSRSIRQMRLPPHQHPGGVDVLGCALTSFSCEPRRPGRSPVFRQMEVPR